VVIDLPDTLSRLAVHCRAKRKEVSDVPAKRLIAFLIPLVAVCVAAQEPEQKAPDLAAPAEVIAQASLPDAPSAEATAARQEKQINVNWLYGSYVPKEVPMESLNGKRRFKLYIRQTYTTWGIYLKTTLFAISDQHHHSIPEWGDGFEGFAKRLGTRQAEFVIQNSVISLGDGLVGWEPRYDRCRCSGLWPRTRHAMVRNFVTYDRTEKSLRPQLFTYAGAFAGAVTATTWEAGTINWRVEGYQAAITQVPIGIGINLIGEFAPEVVRMLHLKKK
jgi:hypothetical protein